MSYGLDALNDSLGTNAFKGCANLTDIILFDDSLSSATKQPDGSDYTSFNLANFLKASIRRVDSVESSLSISFIREGTILSNGIMHYIGESGILSGVSHAGITHAHIIGYETIGNSAFVSATDLIEVTISKSVKKIDYYAFKNAYNLNKITFEDGAILTDILYAAFQNTKIQSIIIPKSVTILGIVAFSGCSEWQRLHLKVNRR